jgi:hypothetical protein
MAEQIREGSLQSYGVVVERDVFAAIATIPQGGRLTSAKSKQLINNSIIQGRLGD